MRILFVTPELPFPPTWGYSIRISKFLSLLARRHSVLLLTYAADGDDEKIRALEAMGLEVHPVRGGDNRSTGKRVAQFASLFSGRSYQGRYLYSDAMQRTLNELCAGQPFDIIQVETSQMVTFAFDSRSPLVIDEHDIVFELLGRIAETERSLFRRVYNLSERRKYQREEIERWRRASACVVTSAREVPVVHGAGITAPVLAAPNGVDIEYFATSEIVPDADTLVMTGLMRTRPNIDAAVYFVKDIFPKILAARPSARIYIVGGDPPDEVTRLANANVVITGGVPDVRPFVHKASVVVVPLRMGGGTRLKVLEGLSMKKAMVSTSIGCEGIDVKNEEHLLIADQAENFARAVLRLMSDPAGGATLANRGFALVERQYRWEMVIEHLELLYAQLIAARQVPSQHRA